MKHNDETHSSRADLTSYERFKKNSTKTSPENSLTDSVDGYCRLGGATLPAFTHTVEGTLSHYRHVIEKRTQIRFTGVIIDLENGAIFVFLDDAHNLSNESGCTMNDHRFRFELGLWLYMKTRRTTFLYIDYAEQGAQAPDRLKLSFDAGALNVTYSI